jgi:16S rRNA G1207 methylase RsmC
MNQAHYYFDKTPDTADNFKISVRLPNPKDLEHLKKREVFSSANVFSNTEIDLGTKVLLQFIYTLPNKKITFLDLGCGWGAISLFASLLRPKFKIYAVDINSKALELTKKNAKLLGLNNIKVFSESALSRKLKRDNENIDILFSNPPIRVGQKETIKILSKWNSYLSKNGQMYFVIQRNLGADSIQKQLTKLKINTQRIKSSKGFRVFLTE